MRVIATGGWNNIGLGPELWGYAVLIENSGATAQNVTLKIEALDATGAVIDTKPKAVITAPANAQAGGFGQLKGVPVDKDVASVVATIEAVEDSWFGSSSMTVSDTVEQGESVTGNVSSSAGVELKLTSVTALILGSDGVIVGGGITSLTVPASGSVGFDIGLSGAREGDLLVLGSPPARQM